MPPKNDKKDGAADELISQCLSQMQDLLTSELNTLREQFICSASSNTSSSSLLAPKPPKIVLPSFGGTNPLDWIFQAEQYFEFSQTPPHQRLTYIPFFMQGPALGWYKWMHSNHQLTSWEAFTRDLELRFGPSMFANHQAALFKLKQIGSVMDYQLQFESLCNRVDGLPPKAILNYFISGLRNEIQREIAVLQPQSLPQAIGMAKLVEAKFADAKQFAPRYKRPLATSTPNPGVLGAAPPPTSIPICRLSPTEMAERRSKGLCFNCDDKWHAGHRCKTKQFLLLLIDDESTPPVELLSLDTSLLEPDPVHGEALTTEAEVIPPLCEHFQLSQAAMVGPPCPRTLRTHGYIYEHSVSILVDSGSSHNIMQLRVAEFLQLVIMAVTPFSVIVGNGETIQCAGSCSDVPVKLAGETFSIPFFVLSIHGADLVLGVQ